MSSNEPPSEEELADLLPKDPDGFIDFLVDYYGDKLVACIGQASFDVLDTAEVEDVLQDTLFAIWQRVSDPSFEPDRPLRMVFTIAKNKAVDAWRKKFRFNKRIKVSSEVTDLIIKDLEGADLSFAWKYADESQKQRLPEVLPGIVAKLPTRQKAAVLAFFECYEDIRGKNKHRLVAEAMGRITGRVEDQAAVRSALRAGLETVRRELIQLGIGFVEGRGR